MIRIEDILKAIGSDVNSAYGYFKKREFQLAEVEVELNLDAELAGTEEKEFVDGKTVRRLAIDKRVLLRYGMAFRRLSSVHGPQSKVNLRLRVVFVPSED